MEKAVDYKTGLDIRIEFLILAHCDKGQPLLSLHVER